jgi:hypothetical protein
LETNPGRVEASRRRADDIDLERAASFSSITAIKYSKAHNNFIQDAAKKPRWEGAWGVFRLVLTLITD